MKRLAVLVTTLSFLVGIGLFTSCDFAEDHRIKSTLADFATGMKNRDREAISRVLAKNVELITPHENNTLTREGFLDRIFGLDLDLVSYSLLYKAHKRIGSRASVDVLELSSARLTSGNTRFGANYTYDLVESDGKWLIIRITRHL